MTTRILRIFRLVRSSECTVGLIVRHNYPSTAIPLMNTINTYLINLNDVRLLALCTCHSLDMLIVESNIEPKYIWLCLNKPLITIRLTAL